MDEDVSARFPTLYTGRGLRGEPLDDGVVELSVNLTDLVGELDEVMLRYAAAPARAWLPLTTTVAGVPELVWETDDQLVPTHVPVPTLAAEDRSSGIGTATEGGTA